MAETSIQNVQLVKLNTLKTLLQQSRDAISSRLPSHLSADRIIKVALTAINKDTKLLQCTRESITLSVMQAAELGLEPGGALGEGYMVPYNCKVKDERGNERWEMQAKFIPGYRGLIVLARRSGEIANVYAEAVYKGDKFEVELGLNPKLSHVPDYDSDLRDDEKNITFTYAVAKFKDGSYQFAVLSRKQIEKLRARSKASTFGPWVTDFEEMAKKTSVRRLSKYLPLSVELAKALEIQGQAESGDFVGVDGGMELPLGEDSPDPEKLMDKLGWAKDERERVKKSYENNPAALLDYLLKKTTPLSQTVKPAVIEATVVEIQQSTTENKPTEQAEPEAQQKRGRGRPPKNPQGQQETKAEQAEQQETVEDRPEEGPEQTQGETKSGAFDF